MYPTSFQTATQPLPVSADFAQCRFVDLSSHGGLTVPQVRIEPWMSEYVRPVAFTSARIVQGLARNNALRMFVFNLMAQNNFANEDFARLVGGILDYLVLLMVKQPGVPVAANIESTAEDIIQLVTVSMIKRFPALRGYLNAEQARHIDEHISDFEQMTFEVDKFRREYGYLPYPPQGSGFERRMYDGVAAGVPMMGSGQQGIYPGFERTPIHAGVAGRYDGVQEATAQLYGAGLPVTSTVSRSGEIYSSRFSSQSDTSVARHAHRNGSTLQGQTSMNAVPEATSEARNGPLENINETALTWSPSEDQPYHPIYNPETHVLFYQVLASGDVLAVVRTSGDDMDYDRHRTKGVFGPIPSGLGRVDTEQIRSGLQQGLKEIREERAAREDDEEPALTTRVRQVVIEDSALESVWMQAAVEWQASVQGGKRPAIFRVYGDVYEIAVGADDESDFVESLRTAGTFKDLLEILEDGFGTVSDGLWYKANSRATRLVNRVLTLNLGLRGASMDSFVDDYEGILTGLRDVHGEAMVEAFARHQRTLISAMFREAENRDYIESDMCEALPDTCEKPRLTFMSSWASLTFVNCTSHELAVEWGKETTALVTKRAVPVFYQIVRDIVDEARELGHNLEQYLLQTLDGRIIEIGTAFLADDDGYVVRLLK